MQIMKKKLLMVFAALLMTVSASAQFEEGKMYCGASLTGLNLSYNGADELNLGLQAKAGYFITDDIMLSAQLGDQTSSSDVIPNHYEVGAGARYYIEQNGIFLGAGAKYVHTGHYNDFMPGVEVGYAFFISKTVTIEPALYYDQSLKDHSQYSTIGLKVGIGIYL